MTEPIVGSDPDVAGDGQQPVQGGTGSDVINMTPAQLNERLERERQKLAKQYGDYDDLKAAATELQKLKDAQLSEQEKLTKRIAELEQVQADWDAQAKAREMEVNERLLRAEVRVLAAELNFIDPEEAWKLADLADVTFGEDGKIEGVKKPLEKLAKDKPHLIQAASGGGSPPNKPSQRATRDTELEQAMAEARERFNIRDYSKSGGKE